MDGVKGTLIVILVIVGLLVVGLGAYGLGSGSITGFSFGSDDDDELKDEIQNLQNSQAELTYRLTVLQAENSKLKEKDSVDTGVCDRIEYEIWDVEKEIEDLEDEIDDEEDKTNPDEDEIEDLEDDLDDEEDKLRDLKRERMYQNC